MAQSFFFLSFFLWGDGGNCCRYTTNHYENKNKNQRTCIRGCVTKMVTDHLWDLWGIRLSEPLAILILTPTMLETCNMPNCRWSCSMCSFTNIQIIPSLAKSGLYWTATREVHFFNCGMDSMCLNSKWQPCHSVTLGTHCGRTPWSSHSLMQVLWYKGYISLIFNQSKTLV